MPRRHFMFNKLTKDQIKENEIVFSLIIKYVHKKKRKKEKKRKEKEEEERTDVNKHM